MHVTIFGTGYVGLVTGTCFAEVGNDVLCVDVNAERIAGLNDGIVPIFEPGLEEMVLRNRRAGRLQFTTDGASAVNAGDVIFIAVGTPPLPDGSSDLQYVDSVARTIGQHMTDRKGRRRQVHRSSRHRRSRPPDHRRGTGRARRRVGDRRRLQS